MSRDCLLFSARPIDLLSHPRRPNTHIRVAVFLCGLAFNIAWLADKKSFQRFANTLFDGKIKIDRLVGLVPNDVQILYHAM